MTVSAVRPMNEDSVKNCRGYASTYTTLSSIAKNSAIREANKLAPRPQTLPFLVETSNRIDEWPTVGRLRNTIKKFGFKDAGEKISTIAESTYNLGQLNTKVTRQPVYIFPECRKARSVQGSLMVCVKFQAMGGR